jgi:hypothetical protein
MRDFWRASVYAVAVLLPTLAIAQPIRPDSRLTPGAVDPTATAAAVCVPGYARAHRPPISHEERMAIFGEYGVVPVPGQFELDHRVLVELGGLTVATNLWTEPYFGNWNAHQKDFLEDQVHALVCSDRMTLRDAQQLFLGDWVAAYQRIFGSQQSDVAPVVPSPAHAQPSAPAPLHHDDASPVGVWTFIRDDVGICGISAALDSARRIALIYETEKRVASFRLQKEGWDMPTGQLARVVVQADGASLLDSVGVVHARDVVDVYFMPDMLARIRTGLATAKVLRVEFPSGNEPVWTLPINGLKQALQQLTACMGDSGKQANTSAAAAPFLRGDGSGGGGQRTVRSRFRLCVMPAA